MALAKNGDTVSVHYTGTLQDGSVFDSSVDKEPLKFILGEEKLIPGFEQAVIGMNPGDSRDIKLMSDQAYGPYYQEMIAVLDRKQLPKDLSLELGQQVQLNQQNGQQIIAKIIALTDDNVTIDANHPLAGKDLNFNIQLVEIM